MTIGRLFSLLVYVGIFIVLGGEIVGSAKIAWVGGVVLTFCFGFAAGTWVMEWKIRKR